MYLKSLLVPFSPFCSRCVLLIILLVTTISIVLTRQRKSDIAHKKYCELPPLMLGRLAGLNQSGVPDMNRSRGMQVFEDADERYQRG